MHPREKLERRLTPWNKANGDHTLRLNYDLNSTAVVIDVGGFKGQWTSDIYSKYSCVIHVLEPIKEYAEDIKKRFKKNRKIHVHPVGLGATNHTEKISLIGDQSSVIKKGANSIEIQIIDIIDFFKNNRISSVDLIKMNIEGGEYDLLERLIEADFVKNMKNIQVQFHDFVPNAKQRMLNIQNNLSKTHRLTYQYPFIWENWQRID